MDFTSLIRNNKKLRRLLEGEKDESKSRTNISDLPVELLQEILSLLPTKDAVRTSVLSKQWEHQWKEISKIELDEGSPEKRTQFIEFVEKILVVCRNASRLKKFSLTFNVFEEAARVNEWLSAFINPEIEELSLVLERVSEPLVFPEHVFNSVTLTKFKLSMPFVINLPPSIYLRCLKILILKHVIFPNGPSAQRLLSSCPSLEELTLVDCDWSNVRSACIACPLLKKFTIREWRDDDVADEEDGEGQNGAPTHCQIVVVGSNNMTYFAYDGDVINDYFLYCTDSVVNASVQVHPQDNSTRDAGYFVFILLRALPNVEKLSITDSAVEALHRTTCLMVHIPLFRRLNDLRVVSSSPIDLSCTAFMTLLRNSPCLESLELDMGVILPFEEEEGEFSIDPSPACFETHLKTITICGFCGGFEEMDAIKYLLQVTPVLEMVYIYGNTDEFDSALGVKRLDQFYDQIVGFPKASEDCDVYLE